MTFVVLAGPMLLLLLGGAVSLVAWPRTAGANKLGAVVAVLGNLPAAAVAVWVLATGKTLELSLPWSVPFGSFTIAVDALSAWFLLAIAVLCAAGGVYGAAYLAPYVGKKNLGMYWFCYQVLAASMMLVTLARNGVLFLMAWELMSLSSFFLVMFDHEQAQTRQAGWTYLIATHLGTAMLLAMFVLLAGSSASMDFADFHIPSSSGAAGALFLLAVVGFGTKAGFLPLHVWLPEAHPAAPSPVSAVMSGVMIKTGIYGLLRTLTLLLGNGAILPPAWWGWTLLGIGVASGIVGVLMALAQHDLKRLLAYHSVENIGIICLGLGLGLLGVSLGSPALAVLGLAGGLLHVWNHAIFKGLLFLGAGAVAHATGTRDIERLGGLLKKMPTTGLTFVIASAAISGLPPLNGFVSELLIYVGAFSAIAAVGTSWPAAMAGLLAVVSLALIGGLAAACFAKAFGVVFLGEPRDPNIHAHEVSAAMKIPMIFLAGLCVAIGLTGALALAAALPVAGALLPAAMLEDAQPAADLAAGLLRKISLAGGVLIALCVGLALLRRRLLKSRIVSSAGTWDCGYVAPTPRMQYTASSFADPILWVFRWIARPAVHEHRPEGLFPTQAAYESHSHDPFERRGYRPVFRAAEWLSGRLQWLQQGRNQLYVLYIAITLLVLLVWNLG